MTVCPLSRPYTDTVYHFAGIGCKGSSLLLLLNWAWLNWISVNDPLGWSPKNWLSQSDRGRTDLTNRHKICWRRNSITGFDYTENTVLGVIYNANQFNPIAQSGAQICPPLNDKCI